jgi:lipid-binding SYLF domain-containing protein
MMMSRLSIRVACLWLIVAVCFSTVIQAQTRERARAQRANAKQLNEAAERASHAARVLDEIMAVPDKAIPRELLERAQAIAVFPDVLRAAFVFGGRGGKGVISRRLANGKWSAPAFFALGGGSFGAQIGASKTDLVLLIMNDAGLQGLLQDKVTLGGDVSVAAGPVGRSASASTNVTLDAGILSYSRSKGAFIGAALEGAVINPDNDLNQAVYGLKAKEILSGMQIDMSRLPRGLQLFAQTAARYAR